jgi:membrane fusion protein, heavy metal efflux system
LIHPCNLDFMTPNSRSRMAGSLAAICLALGAASCQPSDPATTGDAAPADATHHSVTVTQFQDGLCLFIDYPQLQAGLGAKFAVHLTSLADGSPIDEGSVSVEFQSDGGEAKKAVASEMEKPGLFLPVMTFTQPQKLQWTLTWQSEARSVRFVLPDTEVYADHDAAHAGADEHDHEGADVVQMLVEQQWKVGLLTDLVGLRALTQRLQVPGEVEAINHSIALVSSPLGGRLIAPEGEHLPHIGDQVKKGQVLGYLEPPLTTGDVAQWVANKAAREALQIELAMQQVELQNKEVEANASAEQAQVRLEAARQTAVRLEPLQAKGLVKVSEVQAAQQAVALAEQQRNAGQKLAQEYRAAQEKLRNLALQAAANGEAEHVGGELTSLRLPLIAAISGEIVNVNHVEGEVVQAQEEIFRVLNLDNVWIAAHVSEFDLAQLSAVPGALVQFPAYPDRSFDLLGEMGGRLVATGREVDEQTRTVELHYQAPNPEGLFRAGMFADVFLATKTVKDAVAVPANAVIRDNGISVAYVMVGGEEFERRELELGIKDGEWLEVLSGLEQGDRIVTRGAYLVKLASAGGDTFGHGHVH